MPDIVIGCPVFKRAWILPAWFHYVTVACDEARINPEFVFVANEGDDETIDVIRREATELRRPADVIIVPPIDSDGNRRWNLERFDYLVRLRNLLLQRVRQILPPVFWSLDSDILPAPDALRLALEQLEHFDAVGMRTFMMPPPGLDCASRAQVVNGALRDRGDAPGGVFAADVIMAAKVMSPAAYRVDYETHQHGEDVGWSLACAAAGLRLGWCGTASAKHVMAPDLLDAIDRRVGF